MNRDINLYYLYILRSIRLIERYVKGSDYSKFKKDMKSIDAVTRRIEMIGKTIKQIPKEVKKKHSEVFWDDYVQARDFLIHAYFGVNYLRIWNVVKKDIPVLKKTIKNILKDND